MFRKKLIEISKDKEFITWRSHNVFRIEAFSDGVFAFAVTLLIVSLEVPESFEQLLKTVGGFPAFAVSFAILFQIWHNQYIFFRTYGLEDTFTIVINGALLFLVLFYIYPLKFLFRLMLNFNAKHINENTISQVQVPQLMILYGAGFLLIYLIFFLLYQHALRKREALKLSDKEVFRTKTKMYACLISIFIPFSTIIFSFLVEQKYAGFSGYFYFLFFPAYSIYYSLRGKMEKAKNSKLFEN